MPTDKKEDEFDWSYQGDGDVTYGGLFVNGDWQYVEIQDLSNFCDKDPGMVQIDLGSIYFGIGIKYEDHKPVGHEFRRAISEYRSVMESCGDYPTDYHYDSTPAHIKEVQLRYRRIRWWNEWRARPRQERRERFIRDLFYAKGGESDHDEYVVYDIESWSENYDSDRDSNARHHGRPTAFVNGEEGLNYWIRFNCWGISNPDKPGDQGPQEVEIRDEYFNGEYKRHVVLNFETEKPWSDYETACDVWVGSMSNLGRISREDAKLPHVVQCERCLEQLNS